MRALVEEITETLKTLNGVHVHSVGVGSATVSFDSRKISREGIVKAIEARWCRIPNEYSPESETKVASIVHDHSAQLHHPTGPEGASLTSLAFSATAHCLTGCAIGEVLGMVVGTHLGLANTTTVAMSVALAFLFGYLLTIKPLLQTGLALRPALVLAFASDTLSIATMEVIDTAVMVMIPGTMDAGLGTLLF